MENSQTPEITIDKEGKWFSDGVLMTRKEIVNLFSTHLIKTGPDSYQIDWQNKTHPVKVEDVPFFVQSVAEADDRFILQLYDGREVPMPPGPITIKNRTPYISLFWPDDTKLSRSSYNDLCQHLIERDGRYIIQYGNNEWPVEETD